MRFVPSLVLFATISTGLVLAQTPGVPAKGETAPSTAEQDEILNRMHEYADQYVSKLPNFLCEQVTRQFEAGAGSDKWKKGDVLTAKLSFNNGNEDRHLYLINGKNAENGKKHPRTPLTTEGEFGKLLSQVLGKDSQAGFTWSKWETLRGKRLAVFAYTVDKVHSTLTLGIEGGRKSVIPYSGTVYGDPATGGVWQISDTSTEIPVEIMTRKISTKVDYGEVQIAGTTYLLPVQAEVIVLAYVSQIRNEISFENYRKFEVKTGISYGDAADTTPPTPKP